MDLWAAPLRFARVFGYPQQQLEINPSKKEHPQGLLRVPAIFMRDSPLLLIVAPLQRVLRLVEHSNPIRQ